MSLLLACIGARDASAELTPVADTEIITLEIAQREEDKIGSRNRRVTG
jgi:hypothetical protein